MKQIFIINGDAMTGKSILGSLITAPNSLVVDDCSDLKMIQSYMEKNTGKLYNATNVIIITNNLNNIMLNYLMSYDVPISICEMRKLKVFNIKYDLILKKDYCVGQDNDGGFAYDSYDYEIDNYEFKVNEEQIKEKLSDPSYEDVDWNKSIEELFDEYYFELKDDFENAAYEEANDLMERGFL